MPRVTGVVLVVQESRMRVLTDDGRGLLFLLPYDAAIAPQDLPPLTGLRVRLAFRTAPGLLAGIIEDLVVLEEMAA